MLAYIVSGQGRLRGGHHRAGAERGGFDQEGGQDSISNSIPRLRPGLRTVGRCDRQGQVHEEQEWQGRLEDVRAGEEELQGQRLQVVSVVAVKKGSPIYRNARENSAA